MIRYATALALAIACAMAPAHADTTASGQQARIQSLSEKLRCLVCQNQSIADSNADLATDLRRELEAQVKAGRSDEQILDFMVQRYGDFVLYKPPLKASTVLLWVGPFVLLGVAAASLVAVLRRRRAARDEAELDAGERALVERVLGGESQDSGKS